MALAGGCQCQVFASQQCVGRAIADIGQPLGAEFRAGIADMQWPPPIAMPGVHQHRSAQLIVAIPEICAVAQSLVAAIAAGALNACAAAISATPIQIFMIAPPRRCLQIASR